MTKKRLHLLILPLTMIMVLGFATFCLASGSGNLPIEPPEGGTPTFGNLYAIAWTAVNFFALLAILYKFAFNPINSMLEERTNSIENSLKQAETYKVEMEQMRNEAQVNLAESRKEAQEMINRATKLAEEAKQEIMAKAQEESANLKAKAQAEIQAATEQAKLELKDEAAALALMVAEKVLARVITDADHQNMVKEFINEAGDLLC